MEAFIWLTIPWVRLIRCIIPYRFDLQPFLDSLQSPARLWARQQSKE